MQEMRRYKEIEQENTSLRSRLSILESNYSYIVRDNKMLSDALSDFIKESKSLDDLFDIIDELKGQIKDLTDANIKKDELAKAKDAQIARLYEHISDLEHDRFGHKSEVVHKNDDDEKEEHPQEAIFNAGPYTVTFELEEEDEGEKKGSKPRSSSAVKGSRSSTGPRIPKGLDTSKLEHVRVVYSLGEDEMHCACCGKSLERLGEDVQWVIKRAPARFYVEERVISKYVCRACSHENELDPEHPVNIVRAPHPNLPIPYSYASPSTIAWVINEKYENAMPFYRHEKACSRQGVNISRQDMCNWSINVYERWLSPWLSALRHTCLKET